MGRRLSIFLDTAEAVRQWQSLKPLTVDAGFDVQETPSRRFWNRGARSRWVLGTEQTGSRAVTILTAPGEAEIRQVQELWPTAELLVSESLSADRPHDVNWLPRLIPDYCFPPGDGADAFGAATEFRLEARPRLIYLGGYGDGAALTRLLEAAAAILALDGELVLPDSLELRAAWAPVVRRMNLAERVIFLPPVEGPRMAGILLGADVLVATDARGMDRSLASWGLASGTPIVAQHSPINEAVLGRAALWVFDESASVWKKALRQAIEHVPTREALTGRALAAADPWRVSVAADAWIEALGRL